VVAAARLALSGEAAVTLRPAILAASGRHEIRGEAAITLRPATLNATAVILHGLIGERHRLDGARGEVVALAGTRRAPVTLSGDSDMTQVA